jgi:biopolymer transport protein ExbD
MAGGSSRADGDKKKARIEIIPLIDVIFFLLATFVLFTLSLSRIQSVPVQLPVATPNTAQKPDDDMVTLQCSDQGTYYWNREPIGQNELEGRLKAYKAQVQVPKVLIAGDNKAHFGSTVYALDLVRKIGIEQLSIETKVRDTGK